MAAENWSFTPALDSSKITTAETDGKLVITVKPNVFTTDTQYTVKYDDGNGCTASTIFYIKENCSGGGGGDEKGNKIDYTMVFVNHSTTTIEKNSVDDSGLFLFLEPQHLSVVTKEGSLKEKWPAAGLAPNEQVEITVTCKTKTGDPNEYIDKIKSWDYQHDNIDLDTNKAVRFYYPGHNSDIIMALPLRNKKSDGSLVYRTVGDDTNKMYIHLYDKSNQPTEQEKAAWYASQGGSSSVCIIEGKTLNATDSGEKVIGVLPTNGNWSFIPTHVDWLGDISQVGTNVMASNVITNDGNSRYVVFTGTCADCSDCTGTNTFKVTQNGTSPSPGEYKVNVKVTNNSNSDLYITGECLIYFNGEGVGVLLTDASGWGTNANILVKKNTTESFNNCRLTKGKGSETAPDPITYTASTYSLDGMAVYSSYLDYHNRDQDCQAACHGTPPKGSCSGIWHNGDQCCYTRVSEGIKCKSLNCTDINVVGPSGPLVIGGTYEIVVKSSYVRPTEL